MSEGSCMIICIEGVNFEGNSRAIEEKKDKHSAIQRNALLPLFDHPLQLRMIHHSLFLGCRMGFEALCYRWLVAH